MPRPSTFLPFSALITHLQAEFGEEAFIEIKDEGPEPSVEVASALLLEMCRFLRDADELAFDFMHCVSGVDLGEKEGKLEVVYHLGSLIHEHTLVLRVRTSRENPTPIPSITSLWRAADWHEREAYDLLGIPFEGHPDLRRILMPADWEGHPLRKDYKEAESYHDIPIAYQDEAPPDWEGKTR